MKELRNIDWNEIVDRLAGKATSEMARILLKNLGPQSSPEAASLQCAEIMDFASLVRQGMRPHMESLDLFVSWYQRLQRNAVLKPLELRDVRQFCLEALALKEVLIGSHSRGPATIRAQIMAADEPLSAIDQIMTAGGEIRSDASEKLHHLNQEKTGLARQVQNTLDRLVKDFQIEHLLQEKFVTTREGRWVLPIKSGMQHGFEGIVHASSQSRQTVFMEPQEVVPINNRLREIEIEIESEIERLLIELSNYLATLRHSFEATKNALLAADERFAQAQLTVELDAERFEFSDSGLRLVDVRHPLLSIGGKKPIPNTVELDSARRLLLLSGPNAGGKTVLLKAIGLAAHMARCGLPICAQPGSQVPFFQTLVIAVGDSQSVDADLSTFAAHLKKLNLAATCKGLSQLLLIDEICGSTDPEEGAALARAFIDTYSENQTFGVITSHLGALKHGWSEKSGVVNGSLEFDKTSGPTYRFIMGIPGPSLAIQTAKRAGVNPAIVQRALDHLRPEVRKYEERLEEVDQMKHEILRIQDLLSAETKKAQVEKEKFAKLRSEFEAERELMLDKEVRSATKKIEEMIQQSNVKEVFKRHENLENIKFNLPEVIKGPSAKSEQASISSAEDFEKRYPSGTTVHIQTLGRDGIIQGKPNAKGEVPVLSASMRLYVHWRDLKPPGRTENPTQKLLRKSRHFSFSPADSDRVVDLRGLSADEAISQLEIQLDTASLAEEDRVKVVHGHGTESLKRSVRSYLSRSVYVKKWQAGTPETGGDGITWIELK